MSAFDYQYFCSFPPEIHSMILDMCSANDRICLSLANKQLYKLARKESSISLRSVGQDPLCGREHPIPNGCLWEVTKSILQECHALALAAENKNRISNGLSPVKSSKPCRHRHIKSHCECFDRKYMLHHRLRTWFPKDMRYCGQCDMFTYRKKNHNYRCFHGQPKQRRHKPTYWSHTSVTGGSGRKMWRMWAARKEDQRLENKRIARRLEKKLENQVTRKGIERYCLRKLEPKT